MAIAAATAPGATSVAGHDAERLIARYGALVDAPATIVWESGLRARRGLNGHNHPARPELLHVDPDGPDVLETALHEWIHSLEHRGLLPAIRVTIDGSRCTVLARRLGPLMAANARGLTSVSVPAEELVLLVFRHTGRLPAGYLRTRRSTR